MEQQIEEQLKLDCRRVNMSLSRDREEWYAWSEDEQLDYVRDLCELIEGIRVARDVSLRRYLPAFNAALAELNAEALLIPDEDV